MINQQANEVNALSRGYEPWWVNVAGHLGGIYPFHEIESPSLFSLDIGDIIDEIKARGESPTLDPVGLVEKALLPYLLGNRTLVQGIRRAPWMSLPDKNGGWVTESLPPHTTLRPDLDRFVHELRSSLIEEAQTYMKEARTVGILLSGGMDSRVLAGVVRALQDESGNSFSVVGLTWGHENSRDVVYARRITERFGWHFQHYPINAETLAANIGLMGRMGAEVSPLHLHAMPDVARTSGLDVVLAGSYGDSVGRAEFSGRRVTQLGEVLSSRPDRFSVVRYSVLTALRSALHVDLLATPHLDDPTPTLRRREIEQQMHYMRRMLQSCMLCIASKTRFYQLFTAPAVFGRMWGLDPSIRNDQWYARLLPLLPGNLLEIPWARTGRCYGQTSGEPDRYNRNYHEYGHWLRGELRHDLIKRVNSDRIRQLGIFNDWGLDLALQAWGRAGTKTTNALDELMSWLASLHDFLEVYQLSMQEIAFRSAATDRIRAIRGSFRASLYIKAREFLRE